MQRVLVIGASRGIGHEFVRQYLGDSSQVTATARQARDVQTLQGMGASAFALDVADAVSASTLGWRLDGLKFDVIIVNAGVYGPQTQALEVPSQVDFDQVMHTNVLGAMRVMAQIADALAPAARVAVVSSQMASIATRSSTAGWLYRASKAALNSVLKDLSLTLKERAVCVALHPGWVRTDMGGPQADLTPQRSVSDMRTTLKGLGVEQTGVFLNHDGQPLLW